MFERKEKEMQKHLKQWQWPAIFAGFFLAAALGLAGPAVWAAIATYIARKISARSQKKQPLTAAQAETPATPTVTSPWAPPTAR